MSLSQKTIAGLILLSMLIWHVQALPALVHRSAGSATPVKMAHHETMSHALPCCDSPRVTPPIPAAPEPCGSGHNCCVTRPANTPSLPSCDSSTKANGNLSRQAVTAQPRAGAFPVLVGLAADDNPAQKYSQRSTVLRI